MGKLVIRGSWSINRAAYAWLIITEAFEEILYLTLIDPLREFLSALKQKGLETSANSRQNPQKPSEGTQGTLVAS